MKSLKVFSITLASLGLLCFASVVAMPVIETEDFEVDTAPIQATVAASSADKKNTPSSKTSFDAGSSSVESFSNDGPNTVDLPEDKIGTNGNWLKKKDCLMRAFDVQQEIEALATQIQGYRSVYQQKFNVIDGDLESFYKQLGLEQGKVENLLTSLNEYIDEKKKRRIARFKKNITDVREQQLAIEQLEESLKANKEELAQLKNDMKSIEELDKSVNARIQRADEQISSAQKEAARTKEIVQSMWDMLDDRRAKAAYFELKDGILRRLQAINTYLQQDLLGDLEKLASTINTQLKKAREAVKNLEDKGFLIRDRSKRIEELNIKKAKEAAAELVQLQQKEHKTQTVRKKQSFFGRMYNGLVDWIAKMYRMITGLFGNSTPVVKARVRAPETAQIAAKMPGQPTANTPSSMPPAPATQAPTVATAGVKT
jgi:hypothetical protein